MVTLAAGAQVDVRTEAVVSAMSGDYMPLWLNANKYGLSSVDCSSGYVRAGVFRSVDTDSASRWAWGASADVALATGFTSTLVVQQAYGEVRWLKGLLTVGSKEQPMQLMNQELSSGPQTLGINARPIPSVRLSLPDYWTFPYTNGWLSFKGHIAYGMQTDDGWQKDFTRQLTTYTEHVKIHTKAGYLRIGRDDRPFNVELGLEMACQYGGTSYMNSLDGSVIKNDDGLKAMIHALLPGGKETTDPGTYRSAEGNHLGSWLFRANLDYDRWGLSVYGDHFFEDQSSMFLLDYDGYGTGAEWDVKKDSRYFLYDLKDMLLGAELRLKQVPWLSTIVLEYLYTKYQCGPIYHDHTKVLPDHLGGNDKYYNHDLLLGWQHWGQVMGNPLYRSPLYNNDSRIVCEDNRFWAWHLGFSGTPALGWHYRVLCSLQKGWGTYEAPFTDPQTNVSLMGEVRYAFPSSSALAGWTLKGAAGMDSGELLGNNFGLQITVGKALKVKSKKVKR